MLQLFMQRVSCWFVSLMIGGLLLGASTTVAGAEPLNPQKHLEEVRARVKNITTEQLKVMLEKDLIGSQHVSK